MLGNDDGTLHTGTFVSTGGPAGVAIAAGDLNGNERTDIVIASPTLVTSLLNVTAADTTLPAASVDITQPAPVAGSPTIPFTVTYTDDTQVDAATLSDGNLTVTTPDGSSRAAVLVSRNLGNASSISAEYQIVAPSGALGEADNGTYRVAVNANSVRDANGNPVPAEQIGSFVISIPATPGNGPNLTAALSAGNLPRSAVAGTHSRAPCG